MNKMVGVPEFLDKVKQRRANLLVVTQFAVIFMVTAIMIISAVLIPEHTEVLLQGSIGVTAMVISYLLTRKGRLDAASWLIVILGWLVFTSDLALVAGIRGVSVHGQILVVIFTGLTISGRSALLMTVLTLIVNFGILRLEQSGLLVNPMPLVADETRWFIQTVYTMLAALYIWTADKIIRNALSESRETADRYRALYERTSDGVVIYNLDWHVLSANNQALELLGYNIAEFVGMPALDCEASENPEDMSDRRSELLLGESLPIFEEMMRKKDGSQIPVELSMALVHDARGKPVHVQCIIRDITARKEYENKLQQQALYDPLTNLPNRTLFEERFQQVSSITEQNLVAVLFVDLDNFKWVNDEFGHAVGDQLLQELGKRLQASLRETDTVARLGGDEFVIILDNIRSKEDVSRVASKLLNNISQPLLVENHSIEITASIGINIAEDENSPYLDLLKNSDSAMYQVKDSGKNDFRFFDPELES